MKTNNHMKTTIEQIVEDNLKMFDVQFPPHFVLLPAKDMTQLQFQDTFLFGGRANRVKAPVIDDVHPCLFSAQELNKLGAHYDLKEYNSFVVFDRHKKEVVDYIAQTGQTKIPNLTLPSVGGFSQRAGALRGVDDFAAYQIYDKNTTDMIKNLGKYVIVNSAFDFYAPKEKDGDQFSLKTYGSAELPQMVIKSRYQSEENAADYRVQEIDGEFLRAYADYFATTHNMEAIRFGAGKLSQLTANGSLDPKITRQFFDQGISTIDEAYGSLKGALDGGQESAVESGLRLVKGGARKLLDYLGRFVGDDAKKPVPKHPLGYRIK